MTMFVRIAQLISFAAILVLTLGACSSSGVVQQGNKPSEVKGIASNVATYHPVSWQELPGWGVDNLTEAWGAWRISCQALIKSRESNQWRETCHRAQQLANPSNQMIRDYFERYFQVMEIRHAKSSGQFLAGTAQGLITGYYEPEIRGSLKRGGVYQTPLYAYPETWRKNKPARLPSREELLSGELLKGKELVWVADPIAAAFMQIQGSGKVLLEDGRTIRLGFAGTNEQPFKSFAQWLIDRKEMTRSQASMQGITEWAKKNPSRINEMLNANPRYVFFKEIPNSDLGPIGSIGVPLTPGRSIAVDWKAIPQGAPIYLSTTYPSTGQLLQRLVFAQDTGSAIVGAVRADFYWGSGVSAGEQAGRMKQSGRLWVLLPK